MSLFHYRGTTAVQPVALPAEYEPHFAHLHGTPVFFIHPVLKLNRMWSKDKRVCYVTDYTLSLASATGELSRCYKIEDMSELLVDPRRHAVGVRMRSRPFRRSALSSPKAYFEMPVDVVLFVADHDEAAYRRLIDALSVLHEHWTDAPLPLRELKPKERFSDLLVLVPDGSRVKQRPFHGSPVAGRPALSQSASQTKRDAPTLATQLEEPSHAPVCCANSDDDVVEEAELAVYSTQEDDSYAQLHEAHEALYSAQSALDDLKRSNASYSQLEGLLWVYYDDLPPALQRELCAREELTHQTCLRDRAAQRTPSSPLAPSSPRTRQPRGSTSLRGSDAEVLGKQMDALLRELHRKQDQIRLLEAEVSRHKSREYQQWEQL